MQQRPRKGALFTLLRAFLQVVFAAALGLLVAKLFAQWNAELFYAPRELPATAQVPEAVLVLTRPGCPFCAKLKDWMNLNRIDYVELDIEKSERGKELMGLLSENVVPIVITKGHWLRGYDPEQLEALLGNQAVERQTD
jgi:glutaredoxin